MNGGLKVAPKVREEHINLSSLSAMKVNLAVQALSATNSNILRTYHSCEKHGTAEYCLMLNNFFDIMNVRHLTEHISKINPLLKPYTSEEDERFEWLVNVFLKYFSDWEESIEQTAGTYNKTERNKMFISKSTMTGLKITVHSMIECVKFLLRSGFSYVLTENFSQDSLEFYFGLQRACGRRSDNPNLFQFGFNDNAIRAQRSSCRINGNTKGGQKNVKYSWYQVDEEPLPKQKKRSKQT